MNWANRQKVIFITNFLEMRMLFLFLGNGRDRRGAMHRTNNQLPVADRSSNVHGPPPGRFVLVKVIVSGHHCPLKQSAGGDVITERTLYPQRFEIVVG